MFEKILTSPNGKHKGDLPMMPKSAASLAPKPIRTALEFWKERSEAPQSFVLGALITHLGSMLGFKFYNQYERRLYPNFYTALFGPTGAKKTTAEARSYESLTTKLSIMPGVKIFSGSQGSGISLLDTLADSEDEDCSCMWSVTELSGLLKIGAREGSSDLIPCITQMYDQHATEHRRKKDSIKIKHAHLSILAGGQLDLVRTHMTSEHVELGWFGRFLVFFGAPHTLIPFPEDATDENTETIDQLAKIFEFWKPFIAKGETGIKLNLAAREIWGSWYRANALTWGPLTRRNGEHTRKVALLAAVLGMHEEIMPADLEWAISLVDFSTACKLWLAPQIGEKENRADRKTELIRKAIHTQCGQWLTLRELMRAGPHGLRGDASELRRLCQDGSTLGWWEFAVEKPQRIRCLCEGTSQDGG